MIKRFLNARRATAAPVPCAPAGTRVYAIGDIHGRLDLLDTLLDKVEQEERARPTQETMIVFLGDLIDRGPDSAGVVDRLLSLSRQRQDVRFILGNHEEVLLRALDGDLAAVRGFCRMGGRETILSYGVSADAFERMDYDEVAEMLPRLIPQPHVAFLRAFENIVVAGDYALVHAGVRPGRTLDAQSAGDLRWIREDFLRHRGTFEKVIVHGHTITSTVDFQANRIGIDTGAYASGCLTALALEGADQWLIQAHTAVNSPKSEQFYGQHGFQTSAG